ncbi:hypothetical protein HLH26_07150 [Gluconacetobacter sp. 1b LMG 1731]|uniref:Uncharacterized protein n=1 Tax=Gluconacetobacter dulcium TaxID=2729096 RepID=A0A7W4IK40_9PROT|nr:hypothetical protein [Gluconacetobacter dulcium]MBB2164320.1 hypothetical protein [Gluconacetobacter dulcium]MBB2193610.1 hypothetical protein [Gluconacetobacter dulcium]
MTAGFAIPAAFDAAAVPPWKLLRCAPAEIRGVVVSIRDTLHESRMIAFRSGAHALPVPEIATLIGEQADVLTRTLPEIVQRGFAAWDDEGCLYSPHLLARELRRQERARKAAERAARQDAIEAAIAAGELPADMTIQTMANQTNARRGGRPRKGESPEAAYARRLAEAEHAGQQRSMRLLRTVETPKTETGNQNRNGFSVSGVSVSVPVSGVSLDLDRDINFSPSESEETAETETQPETAPVPPELLAETANRVLCAAGWERTALSRQMGAIRGWLQRGCPADVLVEAVETHVQAMKANEDTPRHMGAFQKAIGAAWEAHRTLSLMPEEIGRPAAPTPEWERRAREDYGHDQRLFASIMQTEGDYTKVRRLWADKARELGRPITELRLESYLAAYRPQEDAA